MLDRLPADAPAPAPDPPREPDTDDATAVMDAVTPDPDPPPDVQADQDDAAGLEDTVDLRLVDPVTGERNPMLLRPGDPDALAFMRRILDGLRNT